MFLITLASMGVRHLTETSVEANKVLHCPLCSLLSTPFAAGRMALKRNFISQTMFCLVSLEKQEVRVQKVHFFLLEVLKQRRIVQRKGILIISNSNLPPREETFYFVIYIFQCFSCVCGCFVVFLNCETYTIDIFPFFYSCIQRVK